jgi:next-to-BRCA1 protein 1
VEDPSFVNDNSKNAAINLNLPPESNSANTTNLIDVNIEPVDSALSAHAKRTKEFHFCSTDVSEPKKFLPATLVNTSLSAAAPANPTGDVSISSTSAAAFVPSVNVPMPEVVTTHTSLPAMPVLPTNIPISAPVSAPAIAPVPVPPPVSAPQPVNAVVPELSDLDVHNEEKLLRELEEMGFRQIDLNKEILRQNNYNLEQSVDDLCGVNEWDPLLAELEEMVRHMPLALFCIVPATCYKLLDLLLFVL